MINLPRPGDSRPGIKCWIFTRCQCFFFCLSVYLFVPIVRLSPVKFVKSFPTWQHLAASGGFSYRLPIHLFSEVSVPCRGRGEMRKAEARGLIG